MTQTEATPSVTRLNFLGCPIDPFTSDQFLDEVVRRVSLGAPPCVVQFTNANKVAKVHSDPAFGQLLWRADYVFADGQPMLPMARLLGMDIPERIDGIGLMHKLLHLADRQRYRVFLFGATDRVLSKCCEEIGRTHPGVQIVGTRNGYFKRNELPTILKSIRDTQPDILFLGMGSPMKEELADEYRADFGATIVQGVGGSFDVMAGLVRRAPRWMQQLGLEWLFRVIQEPRRMFWRYFVTNSVCLWVFGQAVLRRIFGSKPRT